MTCRQPAPSLRNPAPCRLTGLRLLAAVAALMGSTAAAPAQDAADCPSSGAAAEWQAQDMLGVYELAFTEHLYLTASEHRRRRQNLDIPAREREFRFWIDEGVLIGTLKGRESDMHFVMQVAELPAEDFRSFELGGEMEFTAADPAAEAALLTGCPFEQLPRLIGETEADAEGGAQRTLRLIHLGDIGLIGTLEIRLQTGLRIEAMHWDSLALIPQ